MRTRRAESQLLWIALAVAALAAADEPQEWLSRMNSALMTRNYDGVFFHVQGGRVETMRIIHRVDGDDVRERLVSLDGSGREFIRSGTELTCYLPDKRTVLVERRPQQGMLLGNLPSFDEKNARDFYDIRHVEKARLMGRDTRVIAVTPRDQYRYGYRLWIDETSAMPLKTQLCDASGKVIEQVVFANLTLPDKIPDSAFNPQVSTAGFRWLRHDARVAQQTPDAEAAPVLWDAMRLPPGFRMSSRSAQAIPGSDGPVAHLVFTDGIASVSVFVEAPRTRDMPAEGSSNVGSSSAFSTVVQGHQVTAVGEVPPETVRAIASSLKPAAPGRATRGLSLAPPSPRR